MNFISVICIITLGGASWAVAGDAAVPRTWPSGRYSEMVGQSPFALATAAAPVATTQGSFAANWYVGGIGRLGNVDYVSIKSRDLSSQFSLFGHEPNPDNGVTLAEVQWSEVVGKSTVTLRKGAEVARLEFNEADLRGPAQTKPADGKKSAAGTGPGGTPASTPAPLAEASGTATPADATALNVRRRVRPIGAPR